MKIILGVGAALILLGFLTGLRVIQTPLDVVYLVDGSTGLEGGYICSDVELRAKYPHLCITSASLTYTNAQEATEQMSRVGVPWRKAFTAKRGQFLYVSAQNQAVGDITCTITVNGKILQTATSVGRHTIATCEALVKVTFPLSP